MTEILAGLAWPDTWLRRVWFAAVLAAGTLAWLGVGAVVTAAGLSPVLWQAAVWIVWIVWLYRYFPRHRENALRAGGASPYATAFFRDILWGITVAFSQVLRPALWAIGTIVFDHVQPVSLAAGVIVGSCGLLLIGRAAQVLGVARALFVHEYDPRLATVVCRGIYTRLRHPMFLGGVLVSVGAALAAADATAFWIAAVNVAALIPYRLAEDSRCARVFGTPYVYYRETVDAFMPSMPAPEHLDGISAIQLPRSGGRELR